MPKHVRVEKKVINCQISSQIRAWQIFSCQSKNDKCAVIWKVTLIPAIFFFSDFVLIFPLSNSRLIIITLLLQQVFFFFLSFWANYKPQIIHDGKLTELYLLIFKKKGNVAHAWTSLCFAPCTEPYSSNRLPLAHLLKRVSLVLVHYFK